MCKLQIPLCFLQRVHWSQEPLLPSTGSVRGCLHEGQGKEPLKSPISILFILPDSSGNVGLGDHTLFYRPGNEDSEGRSTLPSTGKWQRKGSHHVSWLNSKLFLLYHKTDHAHPWGISQEASFSSWHPEPPQKQGTDISSPPYRTVKPDYLVKDTPLAAGVIEGNQKCYFVGDCIEHSLLFHHYQKEQVHFW